MVFLYPFLLINEDVDCFNVVGGIGDVTVIAQFPSAAPLPTPCYT